MAKSATKQKNGIPLVGDKFLSLMISLLLLLISYPFLEGGPVRSFLLSLLFTFILLSALYAARHDQRYLLIALCLGAPALAANWIHLFVPQIASKIVGIVFWILFYLFTATMLFHHVITTKKVTADQIYGAICVYLLIGIIFGTVYTLAYTVNTDAFFIDVHHNPGRSPTQADFLYYSFVTLTTVGYGDIIPITPFVQSMSILEAITGALYLTVLIARLMGSYIVHAVKREE